MGKGGRRARGDGWLGPGSNYGGEEKRLDPS